MKKKPLLLVALFILALAVTIIAGLSIGAVKIPFATTVQVLLARIVSWEAALSVDPTAATIVSTIRLPRVLLAALVGAALSIAGASFQGLLRNPLADPYTIGVSSGAAVGATLGMLLHGQGNWSLSFYLPIFALVGGVLALAAVYNLARTGGRLPVITLLLAGVVVSSFLSAIISLILIFAGEQMQGIFFWLSGGFILRTWRHVYIMLPYLVVGLLVLLYYARDLNVILLGEDEAQGLGIEVENTKTVVLLAASLVTSAAVAVSGMIGFVGLIIPHAVRMFTGPDHRVLFPTAALAGSIFLVWADILARTLLAPQEIPVGIITAFFGAPFFMYLLASKKKDFRF